MSKQSGRNGSNSRSVGNTDVARMSTEEVTGNVATLEAPISGVVGEGEAHSIPVDSLAAADQFEADKQELRHNLMVDFNATKEKLDKLNAALERLDPSFVEQPVLVANGRRGRKPGSKNKPKMEADISSELGVPTDVKVGSNSALVLALVQKYAPNKAKAKTKLQLKQFAAADPKFKHLKDVKLNTGLQANRPPKVHVPRIGLRPTSSGSNRGGKYYALI